MTLPGNGHVIVDLCTNRTSHGPAGVLHRRLATSLPRRLRSPRPSPSTRLVTPSRFCLHYPMYAWHLVPLDSLGVMKSRPRPGYIYRSDQALAVVPETPTDHFEFRTSFVSSMTRFGCASCYRHRIQRAAFQHEAKDVVLMVRKHRSQRWMAALCPFLSLPSFLPRLFTTPFPSSHSLPIPLRERSLDVIDVSYSKDPVDDTVSKRSFHSSPSLSSHQKSSTPSLPYSFRLNLPSHSLSHAPLLACLYPPK